MPYSPELEAAAEALISPDPGPRLGTYFLGFFCDAILLGVILMMFFRWQAWNAAKEPWVIKLLVYFVMASGIAYSLFLAAVNMRLFALHFGEWWIFLDGGMIRYSFFLETSARTPVSVYFAYRAWKFGGRNMAFGIIVMSLILASAGGAIWATAAFDKLSPTDKGSYAPIFIWCGSEVVSEIMITGFLAYHLQRSRTGWKKTDSIITQLIVMAMETQLPPLMVVTAYLIIVIHDSSSPYIAFFSFVPSTYILSLLVVLNKRLVLRRVLDHETSSYRGRTKETYGLRARRTVIPANIQVTTETVRRVDDGGQNAAFDVEKGSITPGSPSLHRLDYSTSKTKLTQEDA